jgi:hypothetical protein
VETRAGCVAQADGHAENEGGLLRGWVSAGESDAVRQTVWEGVVEGGSASNVERRGTAEPGRRSLRQVHLPVSDFILRWRFQPIIVACRIASKYSGVRNTCTFINLGR